MNERFKGYLTPALRVPSGKALGIGAVALLGSVAALADPAAPDTTAVVAYIALLPVAVGAVGASVLIVVACVKGYKFLRGTF